MKTITLNGRTITMRPIRKSKKGAQVNGARVHIDGLTFYIYGYDPAPAIEPHPRPHPKRPATSSLIADILKSLSDRLARVESALPLSAS